MSTRVRALYEFWAQNSAELSFQPGDIISVINQEDEGWWEGELKGVRGLFPVNYVEVLVGNQALPSSNFSFIAGPNGFGSLVPNASALASQGHSFASFSGNGSQINFEEYQALQDLQAQQLDKLGEETLNAQALMMLQHANLQEQMLPNQGNHMNMRSDGEIEMNSVESSSAAAKPAQFSSGLSWNSTETFSNRGELKVNFKTIGLTWISALGLFGALVAFGCAIFAFVVLDKGDRQSNTFLVSNVIDYQVTAYVALYTLFVSFFTILLEWYQIKLGDNGYCTMIARSVAYFGLSLYMWLSYETMISATYFTFLAIANIIYEYKLCF